MLPMTLSLAANETQRHQRVGRTVFAKSLTGEIEVTGWSSGGIIVGRGRLVQGNKITMAADFTTLEIKDTSGSTNSVDLLAGLGDFNEAGLGTIDSITNPVAQITDLQRGAGWTQFDFTGLNGQQLVVASLTNSGGMELSFLHANTGDGTGTTWHNAIRCHDPVDNEKWICGFEPAHGSPAVDRHQGVIRVPAGYDLGVQTDAVGQAQGYYRLL